MLCWLKHFGMGRQHLDRSAVMMALMNTAGKRICTVLAFSFFASPSLSAANVQNTPTVYRAKTTLYLNLNKRSDSATALTGDPVEATMMKPALGLPVGTTLVGIVEIAHPANSAAKIPAAVRFGFNEVRLPTGEKRRITSPLTDLGPSRVVNAAGQVEIVRLDKANLIGRGIFRLGAIAISKSDKKRVQINAGRIKAELADSFSSDTFARYSIEGIELRPSAGELLDKIEEVFEHPLRVERMGTGVTGIFSRGIISDDGVPTIVIGSGGTLTETIIAHELFHIDQRIRQFPNGIALRIVGPLDADFETQLGRLFGAYLLDPVEHAIFFPRMVEMGMNPYEQEAASIRQVVAAGGFPPETHDILLYQTEALALWYLAAALGVGDPAVISANEVLYEKDGFFESMRRGQAAVNIFRSRNPQTPQAAAETIVASLNCLLGNLGTFSFDGWNNTQKGKIAERRAMITLQHSLLATPQCD
jgi:hypothetical protein